MKIELELSTEALQKHITKALNEQLFVNSYGEIRGNLAKEFVDLTQRQVLEQMEALDLTGLIREIIDDRLIPTLQDQVKKIIERETAKAVKKTMAEVKA